MNRIKQLREEQNIRQLDLAKKLNISQGTLSNWERGEHDPDSRSLIMLANILDTTVDYILGNTDDPKSPNKIVREEPTEEETELIKRILVNRGMIPADRDITEEEAEKAFKMFQILLDTDFPAK